MTRIRLAMVLVLSAFFSSPISAADGWMLSAEVDEMEDKEEVFALYRQQLENMSFEVKMRCLSNRLRLDVATFDGFLATTRNRVELTEFVSSKARVDLGDGNVTSIFLSRSGQWSNLYEANISVEQADGFRFKLELVTDYGAKHIVKGDGVLGSFVLMCKEQQKQHMEMQAREQQERKEASAQAQAQAETAGIKERAYERRVWISSIQDQVARNWNRPPSARPGLECEVRVDFTPLRMQVVSAEILRCNGDEAVRRSIVAAIERASPLPQPPNIRTFGSQVIFIFKPEE